ncbi:MAG: tRNA (adenosine(37)-N6)-dimethylallyltransferase MiaA [Clostridia bacterium]
MQNLPKLVVIAGTNASGKSALGIELAKHYGGEIVSADSRQVFRGLNLGSGKVTPEEMKGVPHHLIDVCDAGDYYSMADFQHMAYAAIDDILSRGKIPFLVGGTGLYIACVADGYVLSGIMPDLAYRAELEKSSTEQLYEMLIEQWPETDVEPKNRNRVMRALEKLHDGDQATPSQKPRYNTLRLGVTHEREVLRQRIDERLERRLQAGMIDEVRGLLDAHVSDVFLQKLGLEYRLITQYLLGEIESEEEMTLLLSNAIKQFAKRQMTWFRRDKAIQWLNMDGDAIAEACAAVDAFVR